MADDSTTTQVTLTITETTNSINLTVGANSRFNGEEDDIGDAIGVDWMGVDAIAAKTTTAISVTETGFGLSSISTIAGVTAEGFKLKPNSTIEIAVTGVVRGLAPTVVRDSVDSQMEDIGPKISSATNSITVVRTTTVSNLAVTTISSTVGSTTSAGMAEVVGVCI